MLVNLPFIAPQSLSENTILSVFSSFNKSLFALNHSLALVWTSCNRWVV
nr:unnamed protein product [Callosobruchus analis]